VIISDNNKKNNYLTHIKFAVLEFFGLGKSSLFDYINYPGSHKADRLDQVWQYILLAIFRSRYGGIAIC
jgi:hypothetical protein